MSTNTPEIPASDLQFVSDLLKKETAIVLGQAKQYLISARLKSVAQDNGFESVPSLIAAVRGNSVALRRTVIEALTTNETYFFRDETLWRYLRTSLLPGLIQRREQQKSLHIWCAACSSGQEPYSLAMMLADDFPLLKTWRVRILASDVDEQVLEKARHGSYDQFEVNRGLPARMLVSHFERAGSQWRLRGPLRQAVEFRKVNLVGPWGDVGRPDLVLLRNVLIYFDQPARRAVLDHISQIMPPDGLLVFGGSELLHPVAGLFKSLDRPSGTHSLVERAASRRQTA